MHNFTSQWYNYFYYQTHAAFYYYKNAELLLAIAPLWLSLMISCQISENLTVYYATELQCVAQIRPLMLVVMMDIQKHQIQQGEKTFLEHVVGR